MSSLVDVSKRKLVVAGALAPFVFASTPSHAFLPLLLRALAFGSVRASTVARTATGAGASTVAGRTLARPITRGAPEWQQVQRGYRLVRFVNQFGQIVGERYEPVFETVMVETYLPPEYRDVGVILHAENHHPSCSQSFYANFSMVSPQGQQTWAGGQQFCVPPGYHAMCFTLQGVPSGWQVTGVADSGSTQVVTPHSIWV